MSQYPNVKFIGSAWQPAQFPEDVGSEVAVAGRSNAGKSSAINAIVGRQGLARTSKTPGHTRLINFFELEPGRRLVDLPGYGFARVPQKMQRHWRQLMQAYFESRAALIGVVIVMDARRPLLEFDWQMLEWAKGRRIAAHLLLTKSDKLNRSEARLTLSRVRAETGLRATAQLFSAVTRIGVDEARGALAAMLSGSWRPDSR